MVKAKKHLGQHFLNDEKICQDIVNSLTMYKGYKNVLEVGPGAGAITKYLVQKEGYHLQVVEIDQESIEYLISNEIVKKEDVICESFLTLDFSNLGYDNFAVIGNFPYNISSQILFKVLDEKDFVPEVVGMFQKEVAERVAAKPGGKIYGVISVLLQAYYDIEYLFTIDENVFIPPPKVKSGIIRLKRKENQDLGCSPTFFKTVVKTAFSQRRKTLRNSLKPLISGNFDEELLQRRPETLSVEDFVYLTNKIESFK